MKFHTKTRLTLLLTGIVILSAGIFLIYYSYDKISGLCIGIGAGLISMNMADLLINRYYEKHPALKRAVDIGAKDERMAAITYRAKSKAFDRMIFIMTIIPFLMIIAELPLWSILAFIALYLCGFGMQVYYTIQYSKEM